MSWFARLFHTCLLQGFYKGLQPLLDFILICIYSPVSLELCLGQLNRLLGLF